MCSEVISTRRSVATGCWRAMSWKQRSLGLLAQRVDLGVGRDDRLGAGEVAVEQGAGGALHGDADQLGHL